MGIVMLDNKVLMSGNQMALYVPPGETWVLNNQVLVGSNRVNVDMGSMDYYLGGRFTSGTDNTIYKGIEMNCSESGETQG